MSLVVRLNILLAIIVLVTLGGVTASVVAQARLSIAQELQSSVDLSTLLLTGITDRSPPAHSLGQISHIVATVRARHLDIRLVDTRAPTGLRRARRTPQAPDWFVSLVEPDPVALTRTILIPDTAMRLEIQADPADELTETWRETSRTLIAFGLLACALIFSFALWARVALRPLGQIAAALAQVEAKRLGTRLERFGIPDLDVIVESFNRMAAAQERDAIEVEELTRRSLMIREEERRHLAHELHDEMGQSISAIKALAVSISRRTEQLEPKVSRSADTIADVSTRIYERVRQMMSQLRPTTLDELGLVAALEDMVDTWNSHHETAFCTFTMGGEFPPLTPTQSINLFRIVQEVLTNVAKHANARQATVTLEYRTSALATVAGHGELVLRLGDDGIGFDPQAPRRGLGLVGLYERVKALNGKITLASNPGNGTQFEIVIPLNLQTPDNLHEQNPHPVGG